jgi:hypothetical protein
MENGAVEHKKGTHPGTIPARFGVIWFSGFREEDAMSSLTYIPGFSVKFSFIRFILIMQIRHILIKDHI